MVLLLYYRFALSKRIGEINLVNFIICDDNKVVNKTVVDITNRVMMKNKLAYKVHTFFDYDTQFRKIMNSSLPSKVYILDIETPSASGIDIARRIREKDVDSIIIFLTSHEELGATILKSELMFLTFVSKFDNYEEGIESSINKALDFLDQKNIIRFYDHNALYTIPSKDILYVTRDSVERKCIMKLDYGEFHLTKSLNQMQQMLDGNFVQTHRACIVNLRRVRKVKISKREITFDNGLTIDLISDSYKDNLKGYELEEDKKENKAVKYAHS